MNGMFDDIDAVILSKFKTVCYHFFENIIQKNKKLIYVIVLKTFSTIMETIDIFDDDYAGTVFEDIDDLDIMSFINERIRGKTQMIISNDSYNYHNYYNYYNFKEDNEKNNEKEQNDNKENVSSNVKYLKNDYYYYLINRLNTLIYVFPNTDMETLYKIAKVEWNNMYASPDYFTYIFP